MTDAPNDHLRASDAERQFVVDRLRDETAAGRLTLDEFDERAGAAYAARTRADLLHLLRDLPQDNLPFAMRANEPVFVDPVAGPPDLAARARRRYVNRMRSALGCFVPLNGMLLAIDLLSGDGWNWSYWVLLGTGIGLAGKALQGTDEDRKAELREWHKQRDQGDDTAHADAERTAQAQEPAPAASATA